MAVYHDPDLRIPRRRLAPHRIYHFNVIYNHGTGSDTGDQTSDMELALRVTRALVSRLEMKGYVNSYYHHRDFRRLNKIEAELDRVLRGSSVTVLILTPDFLPKCRQLYLLSDLFSRLIGEPRTRRRLLNLSVGVSRSQVPPELTPDDVLYFGCDWELDIPIWDRIEDIVETISNCSYDHLREDHHTYDDVNVTSADFSADRRFLSYKTSTSPCGGDNYLGEDQTWQTSVDTSTGFVPLDIENDSLECEDSRKEDYFARSPSLSVSRDELNQWCYGKGNQSMAKTFSDERSKIIGSSDVWPPVSRVYDIHGTVEILDCSHSEKSTKHGYKTLEQRLNRISDCLCTCCIETDLEPSIRDENVKSRDINACHKQSYRNHSHTRQRFKHEFSERLSSEWSACKETLHTTDNDFNRSSFKSPSADNSKLGHSKQRTHEADLEHTGNLEEELNRWTSADKWTKWTQNPNKETSPITLSTEKPIVDFNNPISPQTAEKKTCLGKNYETMHLFHSTFNVKRTHDRNNTNKSNTHLIDSTFETSLPHETDRLHTDTDNSLYESSYTSSYNKQFLNRRTCDSFNISSLDSQLGLMESSSSRSSLLFKDLNLDSTASYAPVSHRGIITPSKFRLFKPATALRYEQQTTRGFEDSCYNNRSCSSARDPARASAGKYREGRVPILRGTNSVRLSGVVSHVGDSQYKTDYQQDKYNSPLSDSRIHEPSRSALSEANWSSQSPHYLFREFKNADWTRHHNQSSTDFSNSQGYLPFSSTDTLPNRYHDYSFIDFYETYTDFQVPNRNVGTLPATQKTQSHDHHYSTKSDDVVESKGTSQKAWLDSDNISMNNRRPRPSSFKKFTLENLGDQDTSSRLWDNVDTTFERKNSFTTEYENQVLKEREFNENSEFIAEATTSLTSPESLDVNENKTFVGWTDIDFTEGDTFSLYESEDRATKPSRHLSNPALGLWQADKSLTQMHGDKTERDTGSTYTICEETSPQISTVYSLSAALRESEPTPQYENKTYSETELHHRGIMQYVQTNPDDRDKNTDFHFVIENNPLSFPNSHDSYWTLEQSQGSSKLPRIESPKHQYPCQHDSSTARQSDHAKANKPMKNIVASNISQEMQLEHFLKTLSFPITHKQGLDQTNSNQKSHDNYQLNFTQFGVDSIILENISKPIHSASTQIESTTNEALDPDNKIQTLLDSNNGVPLSRDNPNCTYSVHAEGTDLEFEINTIDIGDVQHGSMNPAPPGNDFYVKMNRKEWSRPTTESTINNEAHQNKDNSIGKQKTTESNLSCFKDASTDIISENDSEVIREEIIEAIKANPHINIDDATLSLSHSINHQAELETVNEVSQHTSMSKELTEDMPHDVELGSRREFVSTEAIHCDVFTEQHDIDRRKIAETAYHALKENQELDKSKQTLERSHHDGTILEHFNYGTTLPRYNEREELAVENINHYYLTSENSKTESSECNIRDNWTTKERKCDILTIKERKCDILTTKERKCDILTTKERKCDILTTKERKCDILTTKERKCDILTTKDILDNLTREERNDNLATEDSTRDKLTPKERSHDFVTSKNNIAIPEESNCHRVRLEDISYDILLSEDKILDKVIRRESNHDYAITENRQRTLTNNNTSTAAMSLQNRKSDTVTNEHISHGNVSNEHISHSVFIPSVRSSITMTLQQQTERSEPIVEATGQISDLFNLVETQNINTETTLREGTEKKAREINVDMKNLDQEHGKTKDAFQNFVLVQTIPLDGLKIKHLTKLASDTDEIFRLLNYEEMDHTRSNTITEAAQNKGPKNGQTSQDGLVHDGFCHITSGEKEMNVSSLKEEDFILDTREDEELKARSQGSGQMNRQSFHVGKVNKNRRKEETMNQSTLQNVELTGSDKHTEIKQSSQKKEEINQDNLKENEINQDNLKENEINQDNLKENEINQDNLKSKEHNHDDKKDEVIHQNSLIDEVINEDSLKEDEIDTNYRNRQTDKVIYQGEINHDSVIDENIQHDKIMDKNIQHDIITNENIEDDNIQHISATDENIQHDSATDENIQHDSATDEIIQHDSVTSKIIQHDSIEDENIQHVRATDEIIQHDSITTTNIQHDSIEDKNIQHVRPTDEIIQHGSVTDEHIQHDSVTDEHIQHDSITDENIQHDSITDENIRHDSATDENIQHDSIEDDQHVRATDENIQHGSVIDENIQHDSVTDENIQQGSVIDENIQHHSATDENIQHDSATDENIQHENITDENIQHDSLTDKNINKVSTNEAHVDYDNRATKIVDPACVVSEGAQTNQDSIEIKDKNNYQEIVKEEAFNEEIKDSEVKERIFQHQYLEDDQDIDLKVDKKIVEIQDADGDQEIVEIKAIDFNIVKMNDVEINQEIIEVKDAEINQEIIEVNDAEVNQETIEVKDAEINQEIIEVNDAEVNQETIEVNDAEVDQEIIEVKDAEINQEIIEVNDAEVNQEIINVNQKIIEVEDIEINQEIIDVNQEIIEIEDAEINQEIIEVKDAEINQEIIEVKDAEINQEIIEVKDAVLNQEIIEVNDAEVNQETIEVKDAEINQEIIEVKDAEINQEIIEVNDAEVNQETIEVNDAEVDQEIIEVKDAEINQEIIEVNGAEVNQEIIEVKDAVLNQEIIEVNDAEVNQETIEVKDAEVNQEIINVNDAEVNQEIIEVNEEIITVKDAEIDLEIIFKDAEIDQEIIEVNDAEVNQEIFKFKDAEVDQEIIEFKDAEVDQEIIDNTIEMKDEDINLNEYFEQNHTTKTIINQNDETKGINKDSTNLEQIQDISIDDELNQNYLIVEETTQEILITKFTSSSHLPQEDHNYQNFISETMYQEIGATDKVEVMISQENDILKDMTHCENDMVDGDIQCYSNENTSEVRVSVNLIPSEAILNIEATATQSSNSSEEQLNVCEKSITESVQSLTRDWHDASETRMHPKQNKDNIKPDSLEATNYLMQDRSNIEAGAVTSLTADKFMQFNAEIEDSLCDFSHSFNITAHNSEDRDTPSHVSQISIESNMQEYSENLDIVFQNLLKEPISLSLNKDTLKETNESNSLSVNKDTLHEETDESDSLTVNKHALQKTNKSDSLLMNKNALQETDESDSLSLNKDTLQETDESDSLSLNKDTLQETDESDSLSLNKDTLQETKDNILEEKNIKRTSSLEEFETQFKSFHSEQKILYDKQIQTDPNTEITQTKMERESSTQTDQADGFVEENQLDHLAVSSFPLSQGPLSSETLQLDNIDGNADQGSDKDNAGLEAVSYTYSGVDEDVCAGNAQETNRNDSTEKCRATNWILPVYRGVCHSVTHPEMPFMG
ncbi:hypothetical protein Bpfe_029234 [Biomphalaria pfeifferi]|uniref:TIR domain-containing protein n=1 Tax=Biomphalaria pfeifferi TaxID=112525 RepID=A0AAD8AT26_BIOPF|nr:hypothetical protein Bpfe_029234 [Biomphalaria pfeifferi]